MKTAEEFAKEYYQLEKSGIESVRIKSAIAFAERYAESRLLSQSRLAAEGDKESINKQLLEALKIAKEQLEYNVEMGSGMGGEGKVLTVIDTAIKLAEQASSHSNKIKWPEPENTKTMWGDGFDTCLSMCKNAYQESLSASAESLPEVSGEQRKEGKCEHDFIRDPYSDTFGCSKCALPYLK